MKSAAKKTLGQNKSDIINMLSERCQLTHVANLIVQPDPQSVLDIGVGFGTYGFISRAYLDVWRGRMFPRDWKVKIDGIEYYKEFHNPIYDFCYSKIYWGDAIEQLRPLENYDIIILMHILEHMTKEQGIKLLTMAENHTNKRIIVGTPKRFFKSGGTRFPKEEHRSLWKMDDFRIRTYKTSMLQNLEISAYKDK